jgi:sugar transferase EpsL
MNIDAAAVAPPYEARGARGRPAAFGPREFFWEFFRRLEQRDIPYAILHGYHDVPARFGSDVDYAVLDRDLPKIEPLMRGLARERGWVVAQTCRHELFASHSVAIDPEKPENHLALDVCSHFAKGRCLLLRDTVLIEDRRRHASGFFVPAPASEFVYLLAKTLGQNNAVVRNLPRLRELWALDPAGAQGRCNELFGDSGRSVEDWLGDPSSGWERLGATMRANTRYGPALRVAEASRRISRALHPAGLHIVALGPDGSGKSTLLQNLERLLAPCFAKQCVFKCRPDVFGRIEPGVEPTPHLRPPRSRIVSWAKISYYFADWWLGFFLRLLPARRRGTLIMSDRAFDDIVIDQRRYLVQGVGMLARVMRRFIPRADVTFVLDADAQAVHARKPELPVEELRRQRQAFRRLAAGEARMRLISADEPADEVARKVSREVIMVLARREERRRRPRVKPLFDKTAAAVALMILSPLLAVLAVLVRVTLGSPILFKQQRPGLDGQPFEIRKFRTMTDARDASGRHLPDAARLTRLGRFLRSTSLDELPELLNVLKGEMSLVGPRPLLMEYLPLYSVEQMRRHDVLPGITGWAQVNGRNAASWSQKFALDLWYVDHQSLWLDLAIIGLTFWKVLKREGVSQPGHATSEKFRGD